MSSEVSIVHEFQVSQKAVHAPYPCRIQISVASAHNPKTRTPHFLNSFLTFFVARANPHQKNWLFFWKTARTMSKITVGMFRSKYLGLASIMFQLTSFLQPECAQMCNRYLTTLWTRRNAIFSRPSNYKSAWRIMIPSGISVSRGPWSSLVSPVLGWRSGMWCGELSKWLDRLFQEFRGPLTIGWWQCLGRSAWYWSSETSWRWCDVFGRLKEVK